MRTRKTWIRPPLAIVIALAALPALGQGISGITVQTIGATPTTFRPGDTVHFTIDIKAPASATGAAHAYLNVFKGDATTGRLTWLATDYLGGVREDTPALGASELRTVTFTNAFTIPAPASGGAYPILYLVAGAYDPPAEFAQERIAGYDFTCPGGKTALCHYVRRKPPMNKVIGGKPPHA
jgi:hypothetical protein